MPKRPAKDVCADHPEPKHRRRTSTSKQDKLANGSSEKSGPVKRPGASHKTRGAGRTLTRSVRQGGLLETLILGDQPEETVRRLWSDAEDALLRQAIKRIGARQWKTIAKAVPGRSHIQCMQRWQKVLEPTLNKGFWSAEEDDKLRAAVAMHGSTSWTHVAAMIHGRNCKQCRERWNNYLDPTLKKGNWDAQEDEALLQGRAMFGDRWSLLAKLLPGRSQIQVRDRSKTLDLKAKEQGKESAVPPPPTGAAADALVAASKAASGRRARVKASSGVLTPASSTSSSSSTDNCMKNTVTDAAEAAAVQSGAPASSPHRALALALVNATALQADGEEASSERAASPLSDTGSSDSSSSVAPSSSASSDGSPSLDACLTHNSTAMEAELVAAGLSASTRLSFGAIQEGEGDREGCAGAPIVMQPGNGDLDTLVRPAAMVAAKPTATPAHRHGTRFAKRAASQMPPPPPRTATISRAHSKPPRARRGRSRAGGVGMPCASSHAKLLQAKHHAQDSAQGAGNGSSGGSSCMRGGVRSARTGHLDAPSIAASAAALIVGDAPEHLRRIEAPLRGVDKSNRILHNLVRIARSGLGVDGTKATTSQLSQAIAVASASAQRAAICKAGSDALRSSRLAPSPPPDTVFGRTTRRVGANSPSCTSSPSLQFEGSPGSVDIDSPSVCSAGSLDNDLTMDSMVAFSPSLARSDATPVNGTLADGFAQSCIAGTPSPCGSRKWDPFRQPLWESPANFAAAFDISTPITSDYRLTDAGDAAASVERPGAVLSRPSSTDCELMQLDSLDNAFSTAGGA